MFGEHSAHLIQIFCWQMSIILCEDVSCKSFNSQAPPYALPTSVSLTVKYSHVYRQTLRLHIWICYFRFCYMTSAIGILKFTFSLVSTFCGLCCHTISRQSSFTSRPQFFENKDFVYCIIKKK